MSIQRVAMVFDNTLRPETTGLYCRRALGQFVETEHVLPDDLVHTDWGAFDLVVRVDDGLDYELPEAARPLAYWAIDTHVDFERTRRAAGPADLVFAAQRDGAERLRQAGVGPAAWLPLACDLLIHRPHDTAPALDWCFVGNLLPGLRSERLERLRKAYPNHFVGRRYFEEMARTYSAAKVVFNQSVGGDVNMRLFEALGCGGFLLTDDLSGNGLAELFRDGEHLATFRDEGELLEKLAFYLKRDDLRRRIAAAGRAEVLARHTYLHRMDRLLAAAERRFSPRVSLTNAAANAPARTSANAPAGEPSEDLSEQAAVSAVLVSWRRPENVRRIVAELLREPLFREVIVWNNDPEVELRFADRRVRVLNSPGGENVVTWGRFLAAREAAAEVIYTQDDDCLVGNVRQLYETFRADPSRVVYNLKLGHLSDVEAALPGGTRGVLLGWGGFFRREWTGVFEEYLGRYGEDGLLRRKADRLFGPLLGRAHRPVPAEVTDLPGAEGPEALSVRADHLDLNAAALERVAELRRGRRPPAPNSQAQNPPAPVPAAAPPSTAPTSAAAAAGETQKTGRAAKDLSYFEFDRPELLARIPASARRVLDVGCGAGRLGRRLKERQAVEVVGVERDPAAAALAREHLDEVLIGDVERCGFAPPGRFDAVVCGDVLEHLRDPLGFLRRARGWLSEDGVLIASLPNLRHHSVVAGLLDGHFTYEPAGLLDEDHLRFFTRREAEKLFFRAGFQVGDLGVNPGPGYEQWDRSGRPGEVRVGRLQVRGLSPQEAEEFFTYQYVITARPQPPRRYGLTSIVLLTHNQLAYTRPCLESVRQYTDEPYELIVVDNGSTDGTPGWLRRQADVRLIANATNRGFPSAVNQGLALARGEQVLLLNNDTLVTTGWLRRMLDVLERDPAIGLVGPLSNNVGSEQQIAVQYENLSGLDGFAWDVARAHAGRTVATDRLVGFCLLIRREVVEQVDLLDERFGVGCYEDDDYCRRAIRAGWKCVIAQDAFVHHFGSRTFLGSGIDLAQLLRENRRKYEEKWQAAGRTTGPIGPTGSEPVMAAIDPAERQPESVDAEDAIGHLADRARFDLDVDAQGWCRLRSRRPETPRLSLCLICRDNERTIRACLESVRPWVDELVVVDTGSTDRTPEIAAELGARVFHYPWRDDFSAARNESLRHARGEWLFWMDSDDTIDAENGRKLRELAYGDHEKNVLGYVVQVHCPGPEQDGRRDVTAVDHVKLIRNRRGLHFEHRIHEQILPAIRRAGGEVRFTDLFVIHSGSEHTAEARQKKLERDFRILELDLAERPGHPFVLFNLGMTCADAGRHAEAADYLRRSIAAAGPRESHLRKAYALLTGSLDAAGQAAEARAACAEGLKKFPSDIELLFRSGVLHQGASRLDEAEAAYRQVLQAGAENRPRHFASMDRSLGSVKARHNLALVYEARGERGAAAEQWRAILDADPAYQAAREALARLTAAAA